MPQGLQVWDASGNIVIDTSYSIGRMFGVVTINSGNQSGSLVEAAFATGTPFFICVPNENASWSDGANPVVTISGNTLSWVRGKNINGIEMDFNGAIRYGAY
jgi:hypothetical protein